MIEWTFIVVVAVVVSAVTEGIKRIPVFSKAWKWEWAKSLSIMALAFALCLAFTLIAGLGFGFVTGPLTAISYTVVSFTLEYVLGREFFHSILKKKMEKSAEKG